jgi:DNA-binding transcriptional LysR family regulator
VFGRTFVAPVIPAFLNRYPRVRVDLALVRAEAIEPDAVDAAVELGSPAAAQSALGHRTLGSFRQVLCAAPDYLKRAGRPATPQDLAQHDCIVETASASGWRFRHDGKDLEQPIQGRLVCDDSEAVLNAVLAGSGVARLPSFQAREHVREQKLEVLLEPFEPPPTAMQVSYAKKSPALAKVSAFVQFLTNSIPQERLEL